MQGSLTIMLSGLSAKTNTGKELMAAAGASLLFAAASSSYGLNGQVPENQHVCSDWASLPCLIRHSLAVA